MTLSHSMLAVEISTPGGPDVRTCRLHYGVDSFAARSVRLHGFGSSPALVNVAHAAYLPGGPALVHLLLGVAVASAVIIGALALAPAMVLGKQLLQLLEQLCATHPRLIRVPGVRHLAESARRFAT